MNSPDLSSEEQEFNSHDSLIQIFGEVEVERINDNDTSFQDDNNILPVIGLGGSAGSIAPLQEFFTHVRPNLGIAYVVVIHLSPDYESALAQVLGARTSMPVIQVEDTVEVRPNCVYVIPPSRHLSMQDGQLRLSEPQQEAGKRVAVDLFFRTLAVTHRSKAMAIVLSGMDGDGAIGIKRVKEAGGVTVAQEPTEAEQEGMPRSAIETGMVDWILPVRDIAEKVAEWIHNEERIHLPPAGKGTALPEEVDETALREILAFLQARTGHDFQHYKRATILRRIGRRLQVNSLESLPQYVNFLRTHPGEAGALLQDLLISVTNFFRDPDSFLALDTMLPRLLRNREPSDTVRVWVVGCATGEEAYSLAMLLDEYAATLDAAPEVQIFATDLDEQALRFAREGIYPASIVADVSPERLRRYFVFDQGRYRVKKEMRERVLFAPHNVLQDAPFSRIDLVSCRNLLIYFNRQAQERAFQVFHFALKSNGLLFLGGSESADDTSLFVLQDRAHRIYEKQAVSRAPLALPNLISPALLRPIDIIRSTYLSPPVAPTAKPNTPTLSYSELHLKLLEQATPPSVLVDANYDIVHLSEQVGQFLRVTGGEMSANLLSMVAPALRVELRVALFRAVQSGEEINVPPISVEVYGQMRRIRLRVRPMREDERQSDLSNFVLVIFEDALADAQQEDVPAPTSAASDQSEVVRSLEAELEHLRSYLRSSIEQYETSAEELKASNEELQALNEEQRSAAEELETSREEIQAGNEELTTVNSELKAKIEELGRANSDLQNLMQSTDIATVFLDRNLHIKRYTPPSVALFHFIPTDTGRPLADLKHDFTDEHFIREAAQVLQTLSPVNREITTHEGRCFLLRISPYRTVEDYIDGVVLTVIDITERRLAEASVRQSEEQFRALVTASSDAIYQMSPDWKEMRYLIGRNFIPDTQEPSRTWLEQYIPEKDRPQVWAAIEHAIATQTPFELEHQLIQADGTMGWTFSRAIPLLDEQGEITSWFGTATNITERKQAEEALRASEEKYRTLFDSIDEGLAVVEMIYDDKGDITDIVFRQTNSAYERQGGVYNVAGRSIFEVIPGVEDYWLDLYKKVARTGESIREENYQQDVDRWFDVYFSRVDENGRLVAIVFTDITERKRQEQRQVFLLQLADALRFVSDPVEIQTTAARILGQHLQVNRAFYAEVEDEEWVIVNPYEQGVPPQAQGRHPIAQFGAWILDTFRSGQHLVIRDLHADTRFEQSQRTAHEAFRIRGAVATPLVKDGTLVAILVVHTAGPRNWREHEIALLQETAERTWVAVELARTEAALRVSEEKYRALFNSMDEAYAVVEVMADEQGNWNDFLFLDANPAFMEHTTMPYPVGKTATELLGAPNPRWAQVYGKVAETGESVRIEDAEPTLGRVFDLNIFRLGGPGSRRVAVLFTNITHRKEAEAAVQQSEARLHAIANLVPDLLWSNDSTGYTDWYNEQWLNYTGQTLEEAKNYGWLNVIHPDDRDNSLRNFQGAVDRGEPLRKEHRIRRHDGQYHWFLFQAQPLKDNNGHIVRWFGSATDIQDSKEAQQAVLDSEERLRIAIDAGELATWNWDVERDEIHWNERHFLLFGMTPREGALHERDFSSHIYPDDYNFVEARLGNAVDTAGSFEAEFRIIREDNGEVRWMNGYGRTTESRDGHTTRMVGVMFDSTERRQAQEILQRTHEDLEKRVEERTRELKQALQQVRAEVEHRQALEQARGELMRRIVNTQEEERGRISRELHDNLGQHLTALSLGLQSLEMQISTITGDKKVPQLDNMRVIVDDLMRAAHDQARQLRPAELDAMGLEAALGQYIRDWKERTGIEVDLQAVGWEIRPSPEVETTLYRVVQEALTNVARHAEATEVSVVIERNQNMASAIIEDNGRGFDTEKSTSRLGIVGMQERLSIVGGTLDIESAPGESTTLFARVPLTAKATKSN